MSVLLEFSMSPLDKGASLATYVARSLDIIDQSGIPYELNAMGTVIEGEWEECIRLVTACYERMSQDCERISCTIKVDARRGGSDRLKSKIARIEKTLGRSLRTSSSVLPPTSEA